MKKIISLIICFVTLLTAFSGFYFPIAVADTSTELPVLDYDTLFESAYIINGSWTDADLYQGNSLSFYFRGNDITESFDSSRHFCNFDTAYNYYLSQNPDILEDLPVFIFAPGTYDKLITVRYSAIILGANAGIDPNGEQEWTIEGMSKGVPENPERKNETVFSAGLTRTTRGSSNDAKWSYTLENTEAEAGKKANIKFVIDGVKITGSVGISQYDYSNRLYTDLKLNGSAFEYTPTGKRTTLTALLNSTVDSFSGTGANALFSARCNSLNKNDALMQNVRLTNISKSAKFLFNKFFRNLTIDGMYFALSQSSLFGTSSTGSSFCGSSSASTAEYDQQIEIKNSVFYKNAVTMPISLGNASAGKGYTKMTANIHNNFFYDAVFFEEVQNYWGIFLIYSAKSGVDYVVNITDNVFHQQTTRFKTLFNGNTSYQKSKTTVNFNRNRITGNVDSIYPATSWGESYFEFINTSLFYDFSNNFHAYSPQDIAKRPHWTNPPKTTLASGYDYTTATYYLDYDLKVLSTDFDIRRVSGLGSEITVDGYDITADCSDMSGVVTPTILTWGSADIEIFSDKELTNKITKINLDKVEKGATFYVKMTSSSLSVVGMLSIWKGKYSNISSVRDIDKSKFEFPVISVTTENGAPIVDKVNYVTCGVSITNTDAQYCMTDTLAGIRFRGNSTLNSSDKKPYRIKFDKKQDLFGMGKAKSWVLLANAFDKTLSRNAIAFAIGNALELEYTTQFRYVNLYINGAYKGVFLLCEQTQTGSTRVDVEEDESGKVDTGYLIEMAGNGDPTEDRQFYINEIPSSEFGTGVTRNWRRDVIKGYLKTPELEVCTDDQVNFISDYVNRVNHAILTQDLQKFNELCDVQSFAKYFIVNTILNNGDAGYQLYIYKKENGGKLYAGPLWDFDQSSAASTHCGETYSQWYSGSPHPWFDSFINWPEFLTLAKSIYLENKAEIQSLIDYYTSDIYTENMYDFHANDVCWNSVESDYWRIPETIKTLKSYTANFAHLANWFENRLQWLDNAYSVVTILPDSVAIDKTALVLEKGQTHTFSLTTTPSYHDSCEIIWQSSDNSVASVQNGVVSANGSGTSVITASIDGTELSVSCTVTVCDGHRYDNVCDTTCNACNTVRSSAHSFSEFVYNNDATVERDGTKTRVCSLCNTSETITAVGTKIKLIDSSKTFKDVVATKWYKPYVDYAVTFGIFTGTSDTAFSPDTNMTRAQFVQVLANSSGVDTTNRNVNSGFTDVPGGKWFTAAVTWASKNGIVSGVGNNRFDPNANVTREQMCVMLVNYIEKYQKGALKSKTDKFTFADNAKISRWASDAVYKCAYAQLVSGVGNNKFDPKSNATRAQGATIFTNFHKEYM